MNTKNKIFWISYIYLLTLVLIRFIPIIDPGSRTWGFNHLVFLPDIYTYGFFVVALIALIIPFIRSAEKAETALTDWFSDKFLDGRQRYLYRFLFIALMTSLFILFTAPTHFLGDGYTVIKNLSSDSGILFKWSEIGIIRVMSFIRTILGPQSEETSRLAFQIVSIISGAVSIYFLFLISQVVSENKIKRFIVFITSILSGALLLFFGYAEYYPVVWVFMTGCIYFSLTFLESARGLLTAWLFLIIGIVLHIQMVIFVPAAIFITLTKGNGLIIYKRFKKLIWGTVSLIIISCLYLLIYKYTTNLYVEDIFLPLFSGKPIDPNYAIFSVSHLLDIINEFVLISPLLFLLLFISGKSIKDILKNKMAIFFGLGAFGSLLFLFVIDPKLAFPRDWDLFSMSGFPLLLLSINLIHKNRIQYFGKLIISITLIVSIYSLPFLLTNLNTNSSEKYIESLIELDKSKSSSSITVLSRYYKDNDCKEKLDSIMLIYNKEFMQDRLISAAIDAIVSGDVKSAQKYSPLIKPDRFNADYQRLVALIYFYQKQFVRAMNHINNAIQLRRFGLPYYHTKALIFVSQHNYNEALNNLRMSYQLDPEFVEVLDGLAFIYDQLRQPDSCIIYAKKTLKLDSTRFQSYAYIVKWLARAGQSEKADKYKSMYARFSPVDSVQQKNLILLDSLIINKGR